MESPQPEIIGIAVCEHCSTRIKVQKRHEKFVGKEVRCPKCRNMFTVRLEQPTIVEKAAIEHENKEPEVQVAKKKKRTKDEIRQHHTDIALKGFRSLHGHLKSIEAAGSSSEEQIRIWVIDAFRNALGYDHAQIDTEKKALGDKVDIVLHNDNEVFMVVECKNIRRKINKQVAEQAARYAASLSAKWACVTNGQVWQLFFIESRAGTEPLMVKVFDISLLDEDGVSDEDAACLYLLTERAITCGDTNRALHEVACCSNLRLIDSLESDYVVAAVRKEMNRRYKEETGVNVPLEDEDVRELIKSLYSLESTLR